MAQEQQFLVAQKAFIQKDGNLLVLFDDTGLDFPGGKIQEGETDLNAALQREVHEETGLTIEIGAPVTTWLYIFEEGDATNTHPIRHRFFTSYNCTIVSGELTLSHEHTSYMWVNKDNYKEAIAQAVQQDVFCDVLDRYFTQL